MTLIDINLLKPFNTAFGSDVNIIFLFATRDVLFASVVPRAKVIPLILAFNAWAIT